MGLVLGAGAYAQTDIVLVRSHGSLTGGDETYAGARVDWYDLQAPADGRISVVAVSPDGPVTILFRRPGQPPEEIADRREVARLSRSAAAGEQMSVGVSVSPSAGGVGTGPVEYLVQVVFGSGETSLTIGGYLTGNLEPGDETTDFGTYVDWYPLSVPAGDRIRVELSSADFDAYLVVELPDGNVLENDDTSGSDSSVSFTSTTGGVARVGARSYGSGETGSYEIGVFKEVVSPIRVGETMQAELVASSAIYRLEGQPGQTVVVDLSSDAFDTILTIDDSDGAYLSNDDSAESSNSRLTYVIGTSGEATITVSSYDGRGEFALSVQPSNVRFQEYSDGYELRDGDVINGRLGVSSPQRDGSYYQRFTFLAEKGARVTITLESDSFDSYLRLVDPAGREWTDDDSGGGLTARLTFVAERSGTHEVYVSPLGSGEMGVYTLSFEQGDAGRLILSTRGQLTPNDQTDITGNSYDVYEFRAEAGKAVVIDVASPSFDTIAILRDAFGTVILQDDDGGGDSNSRIEFTPDRTGSYELVVTSFGSGSYGNYTVSIYQ